MLKQAKQKIQDVEQERDRLSRELTEAPTVITPSSCFNNGVDD